MTYAGREKSSGGSGLREMMYAHLSYYLLLSMVYLFLVVFIALDPLSQNPKSRNQNFT